MTRLPLFRLFIIALPLIEIAGFIVVGRAIGVFLTLLLIVLSTFLGLVVLRGSGLIMLARMQRQMQKGESPELEMLQSSFTVLSGLLLLLPGFVTDILGLLALIPPVQRLLLYGLFRIGMVHQHSSSSNKRVIDGEYWRKSDNKHD